MHQMRQLLLPAQGALSRLQKIKRACSVQIQRRRRNFLLSSTKDFDKLTPYVLAIIKLDEGPKLTSQVICLPEKAHIGMKVRSAFRKLGEESEKGMLYYGTKFVPAEIKNNTEGKK